MASKTLSSRLTQGSIFTGAKVVRYSKRAVYGVVITARCDIANDKFPVLNFVPCVGLKDWLEVDGSSLVRRDALRDRTQTFEARLKAVGVAPSILNTLSPSKACSELLPQNAKKRSETVAIGQEIEVLSRADLSLSEHCLQVLSIGENVARAHVRDIIKYRNAACYYIPKVNSDLATGFVALLREPSFVPYDVAYEVARGISAKDFQSAYPGLREILADDFFNEHEIIGRLESPQIEHLLQSFSSLFGRIGLPDIGDDEVSALSSSALSMDLGGK